VEASERDFRVVVVADAVSGLDERDQRDIANIGVAVVSTDELLGCLSKEPARSR
jgi:uncharacterized protein YlxP (DUF503 family)